ncbi:class I SAM-dependent methyltransferase [Roseospira marina]|uniref:Class I SAM-dependent methyltransferase n=1 Tax=Roseospira marina TaxID=140057 RepID=A0A5M6IBB6_9PROT|nr:class I SAM-dependent methyltransferase [Roseospira marina]KAA5605584.1 class I SAM-dependent methyltransferase [Roseospira marina]MBB4313351.1 methylase of polypeptide subunit release factors [Roseospira marina]MBB5085908.1 methylase of polypeptide subunit release factors [Roseospira marina]
MAPSPEPGTLALLAAAVVAAGASLVVLYTLRLGAPPWPSSPRARHAVMAALPAQVEGAILELGCGWGGLALALAARYPDRPVVGVELSPIPWAVARLRAWASRRKNLTVRRADLHQVDVARAGLIVCYLHREAMTRLAIRMRREAPPGAVVVSNSFGLGDWTPEARVPIGDGFGGVVLVYRVPPLSPPSARYNA